MRKIQCLLAFLISVAGFTSDGYARDWPDAGGWSIGEIDTGCVMTSKYEGAGETELSVVLELDGSSIVVARNANWTTKESENYSLRYLVNGFEYSGLKSMGANILGKRGFGVRLRGDFVDDFSTGTSLSIYNGETLVDSLSLMGSSAGVSVLRRCTASLKVRVDADKREKARLAHIPKNPFAAPTSAATTVPAAPRGHSASWVTTDDYPPSSIRNAEQGTVEVDYLVNAQGRIEDCKVKVSSGSPTLDETTCRLVTRRGRYDPKEVGTARVSSRQTWRLPED